MDNCLSTAIWIEKDIGVKLEDNLRNKEDLMMQGKHLQQFEEENLSKDRIRWNWLVSTVDVYYLIWLLNITGVQQITSVSRWTGSVTGGKTVRTGLMSSTVKQLKVQNHRVFRKLSFYNSTQLHVKFKLRNIALKKQEQFPMLLKI